MTGPVVLPEPLIVKTGTCVPVLSLIVSRNVVVLPFVLLVISFPLVSVCVVDAALVVTGTLITSPDFRVTVAEGPSVPVIVIPEPSGICSLALLIGGNVHVPSSSVTIIVGKWCNVPVESV